MPPLGTPLAHSKFSLNTAGVAGFFGGEEAISAMDTVHLYKGRRWLGWFNSPGSYTIAKCFGKMASSRFWDGLFPGPNDSPAVSFGLDGKKGPQYIAPLSGTTMDTGHLAYLVTERGKEMEPEEIKGRETTPVDVVYLAMKDVDYDTPIELLPLKEALLGLIPITVSVVTCVMCALVYDWLSFSMIMIGIISSGWASLVIGKGRLVIKSVNEPAHGAPLGHGILIGKDGVVVIKGKERDVNAITKGHFILLETDPKQDDEGGKQGEGKKRGDEGNRHSDEGNKQRDEGNKHGDEGNEHGGEGNEHGDEGNEQGDEGKKQRDDGNGQSGEGNKLDEEGGKQAPDKKHCYHDIGVCSLVLLVQFLLQLLLIPQGTLFGQIMFLLSLGVSWGYNSYLSSLEKEKIQARMLFQTLGCPEMRRFRAGTRTTMAVFASLLLFHRVEGLSQEENREYRVQILDRCVPNNTNVWRQWKEKVVQQLLNIDDGSDSLPHLVENRSPGDQALSESGRELLGELLEDARAAFRKYFHVRNELPADSSHQRVEG